MTNKNTDIGNQFQDQRRQNALLEKELGRVRRLNQQQSAKSGDGRKKTQLESSSTIDYEIKLDDLNAK